MYKKWWFVVIEILYLIVIPLFILRIGLLKFSLHISSVSMLISLLYIIYISRKFNLTPQKMGLRIHTQYDKTLILMLLITFFASTYIISNSKLIIEELSLDGDMYQKVLIALEYFLISVPLQVFIFFGFYITRLELVTNSKWVLLIVPAIIFAAIHIPLTNTLIPIFSLLFGLVHSSLFLKYRNLYINYLVHVLIGGSILLSSIA